MTERALALPANPIIRLLTRETMRITGGKDRGRQLAVPAGGRVRPTSDKVKQALFNILGEKVVASVFLDLFAGAGGIGVEALSRGAGRVVFIDAHRRSVDAIRRNLDLAGYSDRSQVGMSSAEAFLRTPSGPYDIVFFDPPYADAIAPLLEKIGGAGILNADAVVIAEHFKKQAAPERAGALTLYREAKYGDTVLSFYKRG